MTRIDMAQAIADAQQRRQLERSARAARRTARRRRRTFATQADLEAAIADEDFDALPDTFELELPTMVGVSVEGFRCRRIRRGPNGVIHELERITPPR